jgi:hypothetical protein
MIAALALLAAMLQPQTVNPTPEPQAASEPAQVRVEKLTPAELKALNDAKQAVADAEAKLAVAKRVLQGTTEGIEQDHHANTDCGCYLQTEGRDFDKVEFQGDSIVIQHVHQAPASLH